MIETQKGHPEAAKIYVVVVLPQDQARLPVTITFQDMTFTVLSTRGRRITQVRVEIHHRSPQTTPETEEQPKPVVLPLPEQAHKASQNEQQDTLKPQYRGA